MQKRSITLLSAGKKTTCFFECLIRKVQVKGRNAIIGLFGQALFMLVIFVAASCIQIDNPPPVPVVSYVNHESGYCYDDLGNESKCISLTFRLEDGDGNFGLKESDTLPPFIDEYKHNFYFNLYFFNGSEFIKYDDLMINYFDIPYIEPQGQNKVLIADVNIDISFPISVLPYDTLLLDFYVYDRDLNQSNTAETDTIFIK